MIKIKERIIVKNNEYCSSFISKAIGLRFRKKPIDKAFIFTFETPQKVIMDMWFVFYPIDVIFLDEKKRIIEIKEKFLPFSFYRSKAEARYIIEFEHGIVEKEKLTIGDTLYF
jgi:hypothetical protein